MSKDNSYWMDLVYKMAQQSPDPRTQIGAVIVDCVGNFVSAACNYNSKNLDWNQLGIHKNVIFDHAERRAIRSAAKNYGAQALIGATLFTQGMPCKDCAREIVEWGVSHIVLDTHYEKFGFLHPEYCQAAVATYLKAAGVLIIPYGDKSYLEDIRYDGKTLKELFDAKK